MLLNVSKSSLNHLIPQLQTKGMAVVTYTHKKDGKATYVAGPSQDLKRYLISRVERLLFVEQPNSISEDLTPTAQLYVKGKLEKEIRFPMLPLPKKMRRPDIDSSPLAYLLLKFRDVLSTFYFFIRIPLKVDCFIGVEAVNAHSLGS